MITYQRSIRIGIDLDTIDELNQVNEDQSIELDIDLPIEREDLEESNIANSHWEGLNGILNGTGANSKAKSRNLSDPGISILTSTLSSENIFTNL